MFSVWSVNYQQLYDPTLQMAQNSHQSTSQRVEENWSSAKESEKYIKHAEKDREAHDHFRKTNWYIEAFKKKRKRKKLTEGSLFSV